MGQIRLKEAQLLPREVTHAIKQGDIEVLNNRCKMVPIIFYHDTSMRLQPRLLDLSTTILIDPKL